MRRGTGMQGASPDPDKKKSPLPLPEKVDGVKIFIQIGNTNCLLQKELGFGRQCYFVQSTNNNIYYQERQKHMQHIRAPDPLLYRRTPVTFIGFPVSRRYCRGIYSMTKRY